MDKHRLFYKFLATLALLAAVMAVYLLWARPYQLRWGATDEEVSRAMPGDELDPDPTFLATRAITIQGTPEKIWPWLIQMGYGRAGFYGYDILENLGSKRGIRSADQVLPEFQHFKIGDEVPISAVARLTFHAVEPNRYLIWAGTTGQFPGGFTWALYPLAAGHTRLVSRIRWRHHWSQPGLLPLDLFTEFTDHIAVREILHGLMDRVEGRTEPMTQQNVEFFIYVAAALLFIVAVVLVLVRPLTWGNWLLAFVAGMAWLAIWYAPVSIWLGALLELVLLWTTAQAFRHHSGASAADLWSCIFRQFHLLSK